jgi:hypothetical protein
MLSDGSIAKLFSIPVSRPVQLAENAVVEQTTLFKAFRQALNGESVTPITDQDGKKLEAEIAIDADGSGLVKIFGKALKFENAGLLSNDVTMRSRVLDRIFASHTLSKREAAKLRSLIEKSEISDDEFLACVELITTSQESFCSFLAPKIRARQIVIGDVLPDAVAYWEQLSAPLDGSKSLHEFIDAELRAQQLALIEGNPRKAIRSIAISFCAPELVPIELFRCLSAETALVMLDEAAKLTDHFALVGAFEICGDRYQRDARFGPPGEKLLAALLGDDQRLRDMCWSFGTGFMLATSRLRQHQTLRHMPAFWRRLTAAAHASTLARIFGPSNIEPRSLFKWGAEVTGKAYYNSVCLDFSDEPRWRPDWLTPDMLIPDAVGRVAAVIQRWPKGVINQEWSNRIEDAKSLLGEGGAVRMSYPAIGEGRPRAQPVLDQMGELTTVYQALIDEPSLDNFIMRGPLFFSFGIPSECLSAASKVIADLRQAPIKWDDEKIQVATMLAIYVAIQTKERSLADSVAEYLIEGISTLGEEDRATDLFFRLVECAAADPDRQNAIKVLARRLEALAFLARPSHLPDIHDSLLVLQKLDSDLAELLGKPIAAARMGSKAA